MQNRYVCLLASQSSGGGNGLDLDYPRAYNIDVCDGYRPHKYVMKQSGVLTGLFLYDYSWGSGSSPNRLYVNNGAVPIPEIHTEDITAGENSGHRTKTWGYGYAFVSKGDVISFKHNTYYGLQEGCASYNSTISFVPTRKK